MAELLKSWGYVAFVVDSFSSRGLKDVCGRNWPSQADAEKRALDIDAAGLWLNSQGYVKGGQLAFMGYSYGGGVGLLRALAPGYHPRAERLAGGDYPDCGLGEALELAQATPADDVRHGRAQRLDAAAGARRCSSREGRRTLVETHVYAGAHHSFDALGLPVRYLRASAIAASRRLLRGALRGQRNGVDRVRGRRRASFLARQIN
jgi:dienelactone hydrolase